MTTERTCRSASPRTRGAGAALLVALLGVAGPVGWAPAAATGQSTSAPPTMAFVGVDVLPMTSDVVQRDWTVVVEDGVIASVGPASQASVPENAVVVEGDGHFLMPGLAEMHAHVPPGADPPREAVEDMLFLYVSNGITSIRGMLGSAYQIPLARELERGQVTGPNFYVGAPSLNGRTAPDPDVAERLVRAHKQAGYDLQKIHPGVPLDAWDRMAEVARELDFTFGGHVPAAVGLVHAIETGISTVDHMDGYVRAVAQDAAVQSQVNAGAIDLAGLASGVDEEKLAEIVRLTVEHDVYVVPTMYLWENLFGSPDVDAMLAQPEMRYVSKRQHDAWRRQAAGGPRGTPQQVAAFLETRKQVLKALSDGGARILMGTDSPQLFNVPGFALHRELAVMSEAGMSNYEILKSGTAVVGRYVADHLDLDGNFGTVAPGQRADLLLLASNPLDDLANLADRVGVMVRGRWIAREEVDRRLAALAEKHGG